MLAPNDQFSQVARIRADQVVPFDSNLPFHSSADLDGDTVRPQDPAGARAVDAKEIVPRVCEPGKAHTKSCVKNIVPARARRAKSDGSFLATPQRTRPLFYSQIRIALVCRKLAHAAKLASSTSIN